jgi:chlorophyllide a oxygenase
VQASASSSSEQQEPSTSDQPVLLRDPEARLRSYGAFFGKTFKLPAWLDEVPRVRVRTISQRAQDDLVDLVVLNERLSGETNPWEARTRLELLRKKRKNWEHIYNYVTKADAAATLALIEEANEQVTRLLTCLCSCSNRSSPCVASTRIKCTVCH